ncbi:MAG: MFS transporter [Eubacteriales bacterium]|nr:MFS transporter [Eubacteriales bacterium]MDD3881986.1 MFS transporter [Eubacteriales bacterium]MDD4513113.1 MFS transporter [Eubacteriales bacterium]
MRRGKRGLAAIARRFAMYDTTGFTPSLKKSLFWVIAAVTFGQCCFTVTQGAVWTGYLLDVMKADDFQLGLIAAIPVFANCLQLVASGILERRRNRRFMFLFFGLVGRFFWIPIGLIPILLPAAAPIVKIACLIFCVAMVSGGNSFVNISFASLMADLVPMRIRGRYFTARQSISLISSVLSGLLAAWVVDRFGQDGYIFVFIFAGVMGMADIASFFFVDFPKMYSDDSPKKESFITMLLAVFRDKKFMGVVIFFTSWCFSASIANPFYNVYMLNNLGMSYTDITLMNQITASIMTVLFVSRWGRPIDEYGNKPVVKFAGLICCVFPLLWLIMSKSRLWMIVLMNALQGLFWPAVDIGQQNLYLSESPEKNRSMYLAVFFVVYNLVGVSLANALGGALLKGPFTAMEGLGFTIMGEAITRYQYLFLLAVVLRIFVVMGLSPLILESGAAPMKDMLRTIKSDASKKLRYGYYSIYVRRAKKQAEKQNK